MADKMTIDIPLMVTELVESPPGKPAGRRRVDDLEAVTNILDNDLILIHRGNRTFKVDKSTLIGGASEDYGSIYTENGTASPAVTQTPGTTPVLYTGFDTNGPSSGVTADQANDKFVIGVAGVYLITAQFSFSGTINATFNMQAAIISDSPATTLAGAKCTRKLGTGGDVGSCSLTGLASLAAGDELGIYIDGTAGADINTHQAQLTIHRVG